MPKRSIHPAYRLLKALGCAVVAIDGRNVYLGKYVSPESYEKNSRVIAEWRAGAKAPFGEERRPCNLSVVEVAAAYHQFAYGYYRKDGKPSGHLPKVYQALRVPVELYGRTLRRQTSVR